MTTPAGTIELDRPRVLVRPWPAIAAALAAGVAVDLLAWGRPGEHGLIDRFTAAGPEDYDDIRQMLEACEAVGFLEIE